MAKKNTDTVPAMLTPGEFVIKEESAKKIGYGKLNQMNKTGKVTTKKEAKMPRRKGAYVRNDRVEFDEDMALGGKVRERKRKRGRSAIPVGGRASKRKGRSPVPVGSRAGKTKPDSGIRIPSSTLGSKKSVPKKGKQDVNKIADKFSKLMGGLELKGFKKGGKVTSEGYAVHGTSGNYKVGE
jgi:hypothetical protein|tara:strand:+ start:20 stop:565 length:546 start_codon:yes stop_codon:yes gene_type:complete